MVPISVTHWACWEIASLWNVTSLQAVSTQVSSEGQCGIRKVCQSPHGQWVCQDSICYPNPCGNYVFKQKNKTMRTSSKSLEVPQQFIYGLTGLFWWMAQPSCCSLNLTLLRSVKGRDWLLRKTQPNCVCVAIDLKSQMPWTGLEAQLLWAREQNVLFLWSKKISRILPKPTLNKLIIEGSVIAEREA